MDIRGCHTTKNGSAPGATTILFVDDDGTIRRLFTYGLSANGFVVLPAATPQEALRICKEYPGTIHVLITDLGLPEELRLAIGNVTRPALRGLDVARRALTLRPSLRIIFISGQPEEVVEQVGVRKTEWPLLRKPFGLDALLRILGHQVSA